MNGLRGEGADRLLHYLVWSNQHGRWWRPGRQGYTPVIDDAGRYTYDEAREIVDKATLGGRLTREHIDPNTGLRGEILDEVLVLAPEDTPPW